MSKMGAHEDFVGTLSDVLFIPWTRVGELAHILKMLRSGMIRCAIIQLFSNFELYKVYPRILHKNADHSKKV